MRRIQLRKSERRLAQLAMLLLRVGKPLHETVLMDIFDTPATFARIKQGFFLCPFASTYPTCIWVLPALALAVGICGVSWVVHQVWLVHLRDERIVSSHDE